MRLPVAAALLLIGLAAGCGAPQAGPQAGRSESEVGTGHFGAGVHAEDVAGR